MIVSYNLKDILTADITNYSKLNNYLHSEKANVYTVVYNKDIDTISIVDPNKNALIIYLSNGKMTNWDIDGGQWIMGNKHQSHNAEWFVYINNIRLMLNDVVNMIKKSNPIVNKLKEVFVYSTKYKVAQYFVDSSIEDIMTQFKSQLNNVDIQISDFNFIDGSDIKAWTINPVETIDYIEE